MPFTDKQKLFVQEILKGANGSDAAVRAGYSIKSARSIASCLLNSPRYRHVQERLAELAKKQRAAQDREWAKFCREGK